MAVDVDKLTTDTADFDKLPRHVAVIMDGNGRWAEQRSKPRYAGHKAGVRPVRMVVEQAAEAGVGYLTLFAFSSENLAPPPRRSVPPHGAVFRRSAPRSR